MGTFRTLSADDVRDVLRAFGRGGYRAHAAIAAGTINTNVAVDTDAGRLFLRVNEGKAEDDVRREAAIVAHVAARGVPTPAPLQTADGAPFVRLGTGAALVSLFPWLPGRVLRRDALAPAHAAAAGRALARLHRAGADFPDRRPGRYEPDEIRRRLAAIEGAAAGDPALAEACAALRPELDALERERRADLPVGLIHGDLFLDNVLFTDDGALSALLDFEQASWGRLAYDVAVTLLAFAFGRDDFRADVAGAFLGGYAAERALTAAERDGFAAELRFAACRFTITRITDVYLRRAPGAPAGKDFRRYLLRLRRVREHLAVGDGLLALP